MELLLTPQKHRENNKDEKKDANGDRRCVQQVNKYTHLTTEKEVYCCSNSIMRKVDLKNIASDPKLMGVTEARDPN